MSERKLKLSRKEEILLHLNKYNRFSDQIEVPPVLTQQGISETIGIHQQKVSTYTRSLAEDGLAYDKICHIQGKRRSVKTYFLTEAGIRKAKDIKKSFEIFRYIDFADQAPELRYFYGRAKELKHFKEWLDLESYNIFVISGIAGIGKTAFIVKAIEEYKESMHIFWYRLNEWSTLRSLLLRLGDFLSDVGKTSLSANLMSGDKIDINEIAVILSNDLEFLNAILVFDDYQKVKGKEDVVHMFGALNQLLENMKGTKIIIVGREVPRFYYDEREVKIKKTIKELNLDGLDEESGLKLLEERGITGEKGKLLYLLTKGHPLSMEIIYETGHFETRDEVKRFITEEIFSTLTPEERRILEIASVFRLPIYPNAFLDIALGFPIENVSEQINESVINSLVNKSLLQASGGVYDVHELVREYLYGSLPKKTRKKYHEIIATYYLQEMAKTSQSIIEGQHHLLMAEEYLQVAELLVNTGRKLIEDGYWQEVLDIINFIPFDTIESRYLSHIHLLRGHIFEIRGEVDKAFEDYKQSLKLFKASKDKNGETEAYINLGRIMIIRREPSGEALTIFKKALQLSQELKDNNGIAKVHRGIGRLHARKGEFKKAVIELEKGLNYAIKSGNNHTMAKIYSDMGGMMEAMGEYNKNIEYQNSSLMMLEKIGDKYEIARAYNCLGVSMSNIDPKDGIKYYEISIKLAEETGHIRLFALALANVAEAYALISELDKALELCNKAVSISDKLDDKVLIGEIQMIYGIISAKKKDWGSSEKHFQKALDVLKGVSNDMIAQVQFYYGLMFIDKGIKAEAKKHFTKALDIWKKIGNKSRIKMVKKEMKQID